MYQIVSNDSKIVICYSPSLSRTRYYRQYSGNIDRGLKVITYKTKKYADEVCEELNEAWEHSGMRYIVQEV